ncbi:MAG: VanZ family protein [Clostridiales bacterium]|nr:VanZ family protein [Clostridiales bacterium]
MIFVLYVLIIIRLIVFKYPYSELKEIADSWQKNVILEGLDTANFTPFKTIRMYIRYYDRLNSFENLFGNILIFIPYGYLLPAAFRKYRNFLLFFSGTFLFVTGIEVFQLFSAFGAFDVDDFILNCFGSCIGYVLFWAAEKWRSHKKQVY